MIAGVRACRAAARSARLVPGGRHSLLGAGPKLSDGRPPPRRRFPRGDAARPLRLGQDAREPPSPMVGERVACRWTSVTARANDQSARRDRSPCRSAEFATKERLVRWSHGVSLRSRAHLNERDSLTSPLDEPADDRRPVGRRRVVAFLAALVVISVGGVPLVRRWMGRREREAISASPTPEVSGGAEDADDFSELLPRLADFTGALFGHRLDTRDSHDLSANLAFFARHDEVARAQFTQVADYVNRLAISHGGASFEASSDDVRDSVVADVMGRTSADRKSRLLALISKDERIRHRMREYLIPRLAKVYRASAPVWRRRGYVRIPGQAGDPREYTRIGMPPAC